MKWLKNGFIYIGKVWQILEYNSYDILVVTVVMDPRYKMKLFEFYFSMIYCKF